MVNPEMLERTFVRFPYDITLGQVGALIGYLAREIPARIAYSPTTKHIVAPPSADEKEAKWSSGPSAFSGTILDEDPNNSAIVAFESKTSLNTPGFLRGIRFIKPKGSGIESIPEPNLKVMDKVRKAVDAYFE